MLNSPAADWLQAAESVCVSFPIGTCMSWGLAVLCGWENHGRKGRELEANSETFLLKEQNTQLKADNLKMCAEYII